MLNVEGKVAPGAQAVWDMQGTTESQVSGNEEGLSAQASAELALMSGQGPSQQTMQLEDTQVRHAMLMYRKAPDCSSARGKLCLVYSCNIAFKNM